MMMDEKYRFETSDAVSPGMKKKLREIEDILWNFEWKSPHYGSVGGDAFFFEELENGRMRIGLTLYVVDSDEDPESEDFEGVKALNSSINMDEYEPAPAFLQGFIHAFICHEADEQIWFGDERPFYPEHPPVK